MFAFTTVLALIARALNGLIGVLECQAVRRSGTGAATSVISL
jgi:hypothetical protein